MLDPFFLGSFRYVIGSLILIAILWIAEGREALRYNGRFGRAALAGLFGFAAFNVLVWWGLVYTRPEHASLIVALQTPMTALTLWLLRGLRPGRFTLCCMAVAVAGVIVVVTKGDPAQALIGGSLLGDLLVFAGGFAWVVYIMIGQTLTGWSPLRMTVLTAIPGTFGLLAVNAFTIAAGYSLLPSMEAVLSVAWNLAYFTIFTVVLGVLAFNNAVKHAGPLNTMLTLNIIPVVVFGIEAALGQSFVAIEIGGALLVIGALVANNFYQRRTQARPAPG